MGRDALWHENSSIIITSCGLVNASLLNKFFLINEKPKSNMKKKKRD
jgi:hypothetical protein